MKAVAENERPQRCVCVAQNLTLPTEDLIDDDRVQPKSRLVRRGVSTSS
jgi:hypothetical protein